MAKLTINQISCRYQDKAIFDNLSFSIENDEILCLLGASGCGKTTALKAIAGLQGVDGGQIFIDGRLVNGQGIFVPPEQRHIGMIFQDYALFPHLTVADNVGFALRKWAKKAWRLRVDEMLELVKLAGLGSRYPHQLSGGQQQRVAIARALAYSPSLLLLDEPFSNIDAQVRHLLMEDIRQIFKAQKMAAVFVTHSKEEGFAFADQMAVMNNGAIEQIAAPQQLFNHPETPFVAEFLGNGVYLPAKVVSQTAVETTLGVINSTKALKAPLGAVVQLFVRPQFFQLREFAPANAMVKQRRFIGSGFNYQIAINELTINVFLTTDLAVGQGLHLYIANHELHFFADGAVGGEIMTKINQCELV